MHILAIVVVLSSIFSFGYSENTKCTGQIETFSKCRKTFLDSLKDVDQKEQTDLRAKLMQCFTSSGCKEPISAKIEPKTQQCHKEFSKSVHDLIKSCLQKKLDVVLQQDENINIKLGQGELNKDYDLNTFCSTDNQRNKTKTCLKGLIGSKNDNDSNTDKEDDGEKWFTANCGNLRQCLSKMSADCQTIYNKTANAQCDCAKSDVAPKSVSLDQQLQFCIGGTTDKSIKGGQSLTNEFVRKACIDLNKEDKCNKPFQVNATSIVG